MLDIFRNSFKTGFRQWRIAAIVYFFQLGLALTLGMQVYNVLEASIGNSLEISKLMKNYDHTVMSDFLKIHGASITPLIGQLRWLVLVWLVFSVFLDAGLLVCAAAPGEASGRTFWLGGATYFFSFLKISLIFLLLAGVWTGLIFSPLMSFFEPSLERFSSEKIWVWTALFAAVVWLLGLGVLLGWSVLSRLKKIETGGSIFASLKNGWRVFQKNKARFFGLLAGFTAVQIGLLAAYFLLEALTGMKTPGLILMIFVVQQAFVFFRIQLRQMLYVGFSALKSAETPSKSTFTKL